MAKTFIRFQEYYECPNKEFRKRHFTLKKFFDWYKEYRPGHDYYSEWDGYNFPSRDFKAFINGKFNPLRILEEFTLRPIQRIGIDDTATADAGAARDEDIFKRCLPLQDRAHRQQAVKPVAELAWKTLRDKIGGEPL